MCAAHNGDPEESLPSPPLFSVHSVIRKRPEEGSDRFRIVSNPTTEPSLCVVPVLFFRGPLCAINNQCVDWAPGGFQFEPERLLKCGKDRGCIGRNRGGRGSCTIGRRGTWASARRPLESKVVF